ncbi:MAG: hypothetical protein K9G26_09345 [Emcibacter sp.]|nr:hypothetical protein [Emcibacter sp.]
MQPSWLLQLAMAHFIRTGELNKYIRRMWHHYASTSWHGFALGYGHLTKEKIEMGLALLVAKLNQRIKKET